MTDDKVCPECNEEMEISQWTGGIEILSCYKCKVRQHYSKKEKRVLTDNEVNRLGKDW
jgi:Zn ribbon nucleic-acid-binding protein